MPKDTRKLPRGGVSQYVRQTELTNPFASLQDSSPSCKAPSLSRATVTFLGPKARIREVRESDARIKQHVLSKSHKYSSAIFTMSHTALYLDLDTASRQLLEDIQKEAGVPTMSDSYVMEDYTPMLMDAYEPDDNWLEADNDESPPETMNIIQAARDLRLHL